MSKQTAVEWLLEQLKEYDFSPRENTYLIEIPSWILTEKEEQAKAMEKEQHKLFFDCGRQYQLTGEGTFTEVNNEICGADKCNTEL
jgi:hypothetical protein